MRVEELEEEEKGALALLRRKLKADWLRPMGWDGGALSRCA